MLHRALPVATLLVAVPCFGQELYRQNPVNSFGGLSAQDARNAGGLGWFSEVVDNFEGVAGWTVSDIEVWGGYATDIPGNAQGFMVRFYESSDGMVGPLLLTQDVMAFTQTEYYSTVITGLGTVRGYHYTLDLGTDFVVPADGQYWMSVTAILDRGGGSNEPQWGWVAASAVTQPACMQRFFSPTFNPQGQDVSFVLNGTVGGGGSCDSIDFNGDTLFPDVQDITDFIAVFGGGACPTGACGDIDFNNDGLFPDTDDITALIRVFGGGVCE